MMQFLLWALISGLLIWLSLRKMGLRTYSKSTQHRVSNPQPSLPLIKEPSTSCERPSTMPNHVRTWEAHVVLQNGNVQTIEVNVHKKASKYTILSKVLEAGGHPKRLEECENVREVRVQKASGGKPLLFIRESASLAKAVGQGSAKEGTSSASNTDTKYLVRIMPTHMSGVDVRFHLFAPRPEDALTGAIKLLKFPAVSELYAFVVIDLGTGTMPLHKRREEITKIPLTSTPVTVHPKATESSTPPAKVTTGCTTSVKGVRHTLRHSVLSQEFVGLQPPVTTRVKLPSVTVKQSLRGTNA